MNDKIIKQIASDLLNEKLNKYERSFFIQDSNAEFIIVTVERKKLTPTNEGFVKAASIDTISAFPSGSPCGSCGGTGRAR
jgi:hypothetical protein